MSGFRYGRAEGRRVRCAGMKHSWSHMFSDDGKIRCRHKFSIKVKSSSFFHLRRDFGVPSPFVSNRHNILLEKWDSFHGENTKRVELRTQWDWGDSIYDSSLIKIQSTFVAYIVRTRQLKNGIMTFGLKFKLEIVQMRHVQNLCCIVNRSI